jgi:hypothetical protein
MCMTGGLCVWILCVDVYMCGTMDLRKWVQICAYSVWYVEEEAK